MTVMRLYGCTVMRLYGYEVVRFRTNKANLLVCLSLVNYKTCMYSGLTSTAAASSIGISTSRRFTFEPRVVTSVPS